MVFFGFSVVSCGWELNLPLPEGWMALRMAEPSAVSCSFATELVSSACSVILPILASLRHTAYALVILGVRGSDEYGPANHRALTNNKAIPCCADVATTMPMPMPRLLYSWPI